MNICEFIQEKVAIGEFDDNVSAHLRICPECKAFADDLDRLLTCALPDAGEPPKRIDDAIRAAAAETAAANRTQSQKSAPNSVEAEANAGLKETESLLDFFNKSKQ